MLAIVLGTPSPIAYWTLHVVSKAMQVLAGGHTVIQSNSLETVRSERRSLGARTNSTILFTTSPEAALGNLLARTKGPIVMATDTAIDTVSFAVAARGMPANLAMREYLKSAASLNTILSARPSIRVSSAAYALPVREFLLELTAACRIEIGEAQLEAIASVVAGDHPKGLTVSVGDLIVRDIAGAEFPGQYSVLDADSELAGTLERQYESIWAGRGLSRVNCPTNLYIADGAANAPPDRWHSLLGRSRCFLWGPYIHLPIGHWFVRGTIGVRENRSGNKLRVEVLRAVSPHRAMTALLPEEGVFEFEIGFDVVEPLDALEVTFSTLEGAIEGEFMLRSLEFRKQA